MQSSSEEVLKRTFFNKVLSRRYKSSYPRQIFEILSHFLSTGRYYWQLLRATQIWSPTTEIMGSKVKNQFRCPLGAPKYSDTGFSPLLWDPDDSLFEIQVWWRMAGNSYRNSYQCVKKWNHISKIRRRYEDSKRQSPIKYPYLIYKIPCLLVSTNTRIFRVIIVNKNLHPKF